MRQANTSTIETIILLLSSPEGTTFYTSPDNTIGKLPEGEDNSMCSTFVHNISF